MRTRWAEYVMWLLIILVLSISVVSIVRIASGYEVAKKVCGNEFGRIVECEE